MRELATAIDHLADEDPSDLPAGEIVQQLVELHWQMARLQAQIARRTGVRSFDPGSAVDPWDGHPRA